MLENTKAIIFDLGGVILDIDYQLTLDAFAKLGAKDFNQHYTQAAQTGVFDEYETGKVSSEFFVNKLLDFLPQGTQPNQVVHAWNAMIKELPLENLDVLKRLQGKYRTFVLSNTNDLHLDFFHQLLKKYDPNLKLDDYLEKVYFSSQIGFRKPDPQAFQYVIEQNGLNPAETLFIDDTARHLEGAKKCGLKTFHFTKGAYQLASIFE